MSKRPIKGLTKLLLNAFLGEMRLAEPSGHSSVQAQEAS